VRSGFQGISDEELARQSQAGSLVAFEELVYRYEHRIYGFAFNCCRQAEDAREITQDTFVQAFRAIGQFDSEQKFAPWLFTIAHRKSIDQHRAAPPVSEELPPEPPDFDDPSELLTRQEEKQDLWELARRRLPKVQFQALWLKYAEELNVAEIGQVLRKTQTYVKVMLFRARQTLGRDLKAKKTSQGAPVRVPRSPTSAIPEAVHASRITKQQSAAQ
jgi:RNA polymerase sigma-70 factor (ECF subfamily)